MGRSSRRAAFPSAFKTFSLGFFAFVRAQVRLHQMELRKSGLDEIPRAYAPEGIEANAPLLDRMLKIIELRVEQGPLPGLKEAHARLAARAQNFAARRSRWCTWTTIRKTSWCRDFG